MSYASPQALSRALRDRAKQEAANSGTRPGDLLNRFYFERLLARVFHHDPDGWLLKGGQAMLVRYRDVRHSRDIDLCRPDSIDLNEAVEAIRSAAAVDLGDFVRYDYRGRTEMSENRPTTRVSFNIMVGLRTEGTVSVDLVVHSPLHGTPELRRLQPSVPVDWPDDWPLVRLYPLIAHVADKVCALYEKHNGRTSTRYRDLVDLVLIALRESVPGRELQAAIDHERQRRCAAASIWNCPMCSPCRSQRPGRLVTNAKPALSTSWRRIGRSRRPPNSWTGSSTPCWRHRIQAGGLPVSCGGAPTRSHGFSRRQSPGP